MVAFLGPQLVKKRNVGLGPSQLLHVGTRLGRPSHGQQFLPSMAIGSVATMLRMGGRLVGGGGEGRTLMLTGAETVTAPPLSVAFAVRAMLVPKGALVQTRVKILVGVIVRPGAAVGDR